MVQNFFLPSSSFSRDARGLVRNAAYTRADQRCAGWAGHSIQRPPNLLSPPNWNEGLDEKLKEGALPPEAVLLRSPGNDGAPDAAALLLELPKLRTGAPHPP